jgi:hypothetical protein
MQNYLVIFIKAFDDRGDKVLANNAVAVAKSNDFANAGNDTYVIHQMFMVIEVSGHV